jgi:hypothetical protein
MLQRQPLRKTHTSLYIVKNYVLNAFTAKVMAVKLAYDIYDPIVLKNSFKHALF